MVVSGWGRTSNKARREFQKLVRNKIAVKKLQYLKTKTANDLCKEKISQDVNTDLQLCAGGEQGILHFDLKETTFAFGHFITIYGHFLPTS